MNKKILTIFAVVVVLGVVGLEVALLLKKNPQPPTIPTVITTPSLPSTYNLSLTDSNKTLAATLTANGKTSSLNPQGLAQYATVSFNSPEDIMWTSCFQGYKMRNPTSPTGNKIGNDPTIGEGMAINAGATNTLQFECDKQ